ncbi:hypothetical protein UlMin_003665 [Ulmus minor]
MAENFNCFFHFLKGPLGELSLIYPCEVKVDREEWDYKGQKGSGDEKGQLDAWAFQDTYNMLVGVSKGFEKRLQLVGVGYRATLEGQILVLSLGFSHSVRMEILDGIKVKVEDNTQIVFATSIGKWRPPKPYKGKGVKYVDENIRRKEGNTGKKK